MFNHSSSSSRRTSPNRGNNSGCATTDRITLPQSRQKICFIAEPDDVL
ncbi:MAG: hypothetical protein VB086_02745 [Clostridiaceae bacterium]|nr:hypothetical protein [Clostridiaceae bacterium]